jgi:hypothetical protein
MADVIPLRRARAANDETARPADALDALGPDPTPSARSAPARLTRGKAMLADFALMYRPLWTRLILWPTARDVQQFAFWFMVGGVIGAIASCTQGG